MSGLGVGDWVRCVRVYHEQAQLEVGKIYQLKMVLPSDILNPSCRCPEGSACRNDAFILVDVPLPARVDGFCASAFVPVYRRRDGAFDYLLAPPRSVVEQERVIAFFDELDTIMSQQTEGAP